MNSSQSLHSQSETMKVEQDNSRLVKPIYKGQPPLKTQKIPLSVFDLITDDAHVPLLYVYKPPTPSNATLELGLCKVLSQFRELAGRFCTDDKGDHQSILLNDEGVRFTEASADCTIDQAMLYKPSPALTSLHPCLNQAKELAQIQLTRFTCGSLVVTFSSNHMVADGFSVSRFLVAWGLACRGIEMNTTSPLLNKQIFAHRDPPRFEFEHKGVEFRNKDSTAEPTVDNMFMHEYHFTLELLKTIKAKASLDIIPIANNKPYSMFESLMAHIWRTVTRACACDGYKSTCLRIAVNGRRRLNPRVPEEYFGNVVLWAYPRAEVKEIICEPVSYAAKLIHAAVAKVNDDYFKSFIDFASCKADEDNLGPKLNFSDSETCINLNVDSWLGFPFCDVEFGGGKPFMFMPSYRLWGGQIYVVPSYIGDGSIDVFLTLPKHQLSFFKEICYSLE